MHFLSFLGTFLVGAASLLIGLPAQAQAPANDRCAQAQNITAGSFALANTTNANDDLVGQTGCQSGGINHPDVWFTFTAGGTTTAVVVTPDASSGSTPYEILVFDGTCGSLVSLIDNCSTGGPDSVRINTITGSTYYVAIASPSVSQTGIFLLQTVNRTNAVVPAQDCMNAKVLATGAPISQGPFNLGSGTVADEVTTTNSCFGGQPSSNTAERQPKWYKFIVGSDGKLTFNINPSIYTDDYDWAVWDITSDPMGCTTKGNALACNWSGQDGSTGLSLCPDQEPGYNNLPGANTYDNEQTNLNGANAPIDVQAGRVYALLVDNFSMSSQGFTLTFGGACAPPAGQPNPVANIGLEAEFDYTMIGCREFEFHKRNVVAAGAATNLTYLWKFNNGTGASTDTSTQINPTHVFPASADTTFTVTLELQLPILRDDLGRPLQWKRSRDVVVVPPRPVVIPSVTTDLCPGDSVTLTAQGGAEYVWRGPGVPAGFAGPQLRVGPAVTSTYRLVATKNFCTDSTDIEVRVAIPRGSEGTIQLPAGAPPHTTGFAVTTPGAMTYHWNFGDASADSTSDLATPTHTYAAVGDYTVTLSVTYGPGCVAEKVVVGTVSVGVVNPGNIITPNNDGLNDYFEARLTSAAQHLEIFNRWGRKVYEGDKYQKEFNGTGLPAGTYYYHLTAADGQNWKGWVEIVR